MENGGEQIEKCLASIDCKQKAVRAVRFNTDGNYCLTCGSDKTIKLWNPHRAALIKVYSGHGYEVLDAQSSCDNSQICSCSLDKAVLLWDVASGKITRKYRGHQGQVNCVRFNEEGTVILSGSLDGSIRAWDCRSRKLEPIQIMDEAKDSVTSLYVTDFEIISGSADCRVRRYDIRSGQLHVDTLPSPITCVSLTRDGQCLLASSLDGHLRLVDKDTGELLNRLCEICETVCFAITDFLEHFLLFDNSKDNVITDREDTSEILAMPQGEGTLCNSSYTGHKNVSYKIDSVISSDDKVILSGSEDGQIYMWDLVDGKVIGRLPHIEGKVVHSLSFHPTRCCLISACDNKMFVWQSKYGQTIQT